MSYIKLPEDKVIIEAALSGALVFKSMNPNLPEQPDEIAQAAYDCYNEGAAIAHIHARDAEGQTTGDVEVFRKIHQGIRAKCNLIIQDSTGGGPNLTMEDRLACLDADPEMASLNMGSMMRTVGAYAGTVFQCLRSDIEAFVTRMKEKGVKPEIEIYNTGMFREMHNIIDKGLVEEPYWVDLIVGMAYQGCVDATPEYLMGYLPFLPDGSLFNTLAIGKAQTPLVTMGMILGGGIRVGMEDNLYYRKGEPCTSNAQLVARIVRIAREIGKEPATPDEARQILGIKPLKK